MNSKFIGTKHQSHHFSQIFGMHHSTVFTLYSLKYTVDSKVIWFQYRKVIFLDRGFKTCVPFPMVTLCVRVTQVVCKKWRYLTCNNEQTRANSRHSFGKKYRNKITASELLNYRSQISVKMSCENLLTGEIIAIFSYCPHLREKDRDRGGETHTHTHTQMHVHTQVNLKTTNPLPFPCNTMTDERMTDYCVIQHSVIQTRSYYHKGPSFSSQTFCSYILISDTW